MWNAQYTLRIAANKVQVPNNLLVKALTVNIFEKTSLIKITFGSLQVELVFLGATAFPSSKGGAERCLWR